MDLEPALRDAARRIGKCLNRFAEGKGWPRESYYVVMTINVNWYLFYVEFLASAFDDLKPDDLRYYDEIQDFLEAELADQPELYEYLYLILGPLKGYSPAGDRDNGESMVEVDESLLNPGKPPLRDLVATP